MRLRGNFKTNQEVSVFYYTKALSGKYGLDFFFNSQHDLSFSYM